MLFPLLRDAVERSGLSTARGLTPASPGWATASLLRSIARAVYSMAAGWQFVMVWATFESLGGRGLLLALAHAAIGALAIVGPRHRFPASIFLGMAALGAWSYVASGDIDSVLTFAACWQINFSSCVAGLLILRRYVVVLVLAAAAAVAAALLTALPEWGWSFPATICITQASIIIALRLGLSSLLELARGADSATIEAEWETGRARVRRHLSARIAEESRVLHDTAINTLGAIANGGAGVKLPAQVRRQCARDVAMLQSLSGSGPLPDAEGLRDVFSQPGLPIVRTGLDDEAIEQLTQQLDQQTVTGIVGCVREAVTNATKHSGADSVEVSLIVEGQALLIRVQDLGIGFSGVAANGRGVDSSILARARDHGFEAEVTSRPGAGTTVRLRVSLRREAETQLTDLDNGADSAVDALRQRSGMLWCVGVTAVSVVLTIVGGSNHDLALFPMIGVMVFALVCARMRGLQARRGLLTVVLLVSTCAASFLSAQAVAFGAQDAIHWQALAATGPFALLLASSRVRVSIIGSVIWLSLIITMAWTVFPTSATATAITLIAGIVGLGFSWIWTLFQTFVVRLGWQELRAHRETFEMRLQADLEAAAQAGYRRWVAAGLEAAVTLLRGIADDRLAPHDPETRSACGEEEKYLRQLIQLSPELVHLGRELMPTLRYARERDIAFTLRIGNTDAPDPETARGIAAAILASLASTSRGERLFATLFPVRDGLQLTLVGPSPSAPELPDVAARRERLGNVELIELTYGDQIRTRGTLMP